MFELDEIPDISPRHNIAPTQEIAAIIAPEGKRELHMMRWGLIPSWAKDASIVQRMINARSETVAEKPSFRTAFRRRRCLVVADGFYEWTDPEPEGSLFAQPSSCEKPRRQPHWIGRKDRLPFAFAGLYELNQATELGPVETVTIITCEANHLIAPLHDRMPVVLDPRDWDFWLDPVHQNLETLQALLVPAPDEDWETFRVSTKVNSPRVEGPELSEALPA